MTDQTETDEPVPNRSRRNVLRLAGVLSTSALAGCGGILGEGSDSNTTETGQSTPTPKSLNTPEPGGPTDPPESSRRRWAYSLGSTLRAKPAVVDGTVVYGLEDGTVAGFNVQDGVRQWRYETAGSASVLDLVVGESVAYVGTEDGVVEAFDLTDRTQVWQAAVNDEPQVNALTLADGQLYAGTTRLVGSGEDLSVTGRCLAYDAADGAKQWETDLDQGIATRPAVDGDSVYAGAAEVVALNTETGGTRWTAGMDDNTINGFTLDGGTLFVTSRELVRAVDTSDGSVVWEYEQSLSSTGDPALDDGQLYTSTGLLEMGALDAATGDLVWGTDIGESPSTDVLVDDSHIYVGGYSLLALDRDEGAVAWTHEVPGTMNVLTVADSVVYAGDSSGTAVAIEI